jgi:hypothetical protein
MTGQTEGERGGNCSAKQYAGKISDEFADRLAALPPEQNVRAVVMPASYLVNSGSGTRVRGEERQAILRESRIRTQETFAEVDSVLAEVGGQRLTECGNALGFIVVETTPNGIIAIADLGWVGTVMEDQAIRPVHQVVSPPTR